MLTCVHQAQLSECIQRQPSIVGEKNTTCSSLNMQVKEAFKRLSLLHHPDRVPATERKAAEENFHRISSAYSEAVRQYGKASHAPVLGLTMNFQLWRAE